MLAIQLWEAKSELGENEEAGECIAVLFALWTGGAEEKPAAFGPSRPATFLQRYLLPHCPPLTAAVAQPGLLGLVLAIKGQRRCADLALARLSLGLL